MSGPLRRAAGRPVRRGLARLGYEVVRPGDVSLPPDCDGFTASVIGRIAPYTLTGPERVMGLVAAVRHVVRAGIPGDIVECGVWRGGSMMAAALTLLDEGVTDRDLHLFDTFTHMPDPGEHDVDISGVAAADIIDEARASEVFRHLPDDEVRAVIAGTGYPAAHTHLVKGLVEHTIPDRAPERIALCRLDTDWYTSTAHEMRHLWPRIVPGGILIVDDYGHFLGARKAVDEHFAELGLPVLLHRLDFTGRLVVKPADPA